MLNVELNFFERLCVVFSGLRRLDTGRWYDGNDNVHSIPRKPVKVPYHGRTKNYATHVLQNQCLGILYNMKTYFELLG